MASLSIGTAHFPAWFAPNAGVAQTAIDGQSFGYLLGPGTESAPERHETQYSEMFGSRAIYHKGWKAVTFHPVGPLYDDQEANAPLDEDVWELYNVREDLSETTDLAAQHPDLVAELAPRERFRYPGWRAGAGDGSCQRGRGNARARRP